MQRPVLVRVMGQSDVTPDMGDRLMSATFKQAYDSDELVQLHAQATDPDARSVLAAAADASGVMAALRGAGDFDVRGAVTDAVKMAVNAARQGLKLSDVLQNADFDMNPEAYPVATFLAKNIRSPKAMAEGLRRWGQLALQNARTAEENQYQGGLLGPAPTLSRQEIFARIGDAYNPTEQAVAPAPTQGAQVAEPLDKLANESQPLADELSQSNAGDLAQSQSGQEPTAINNIAAQSQFSQENPNGEANAATPVNDAAQAAQAPTSVVARHSTWRKNAIQAGRVARELGLAPKGKSLPQIVAEVDAHDAAQNQATAPDTQEQAATETIANKPPAKRKLPPKLAAKAAEVEAQRAAYFAPGNVVASYAGNDRVVAYTPADAQGNWSVTVQAVQKQGNDWVNAPGKKEHTHSTQPDARALKVGPVVVAKPNKATAPVQQAQAATNSVAETAEQGAMFSRAQPPMSPDLARTILALGRPPARATKESVRAAVRELVNGLGLLLNRLGRVVVATAAEIKQEWEPLIGPTGMEASGSAGHAQGFYDHKSKTVFLIADHIKAGDELGVAAHELMHKHGPAVLGQENWDKLHSAIGGWAKANAGSMERIVYDEAARRVQASDPELSTQELFPYAVQVALEMGVRPNALAPQGTVARWLGQVRAALRTVWEKIVRKPDSFKSQDLVNLAFGIAQRENPAYAGGLDGVVGRSDAEKAKVLQGDPVAVLRMEDAPSGGYAAVEQWAASLFAKQGGESHQP